MLLYIGRGNWVPGLPARDLGSGEVKILGGEKLLLATGLYMKPKPKQDKSAGPPKENKSNGGR